MQSTLQEEIWCNEGNGPALGSTAHIGGSISIYRAHYAPWKLYTAFSNTFYDPVRNRLRNVPPSNVRLDDRNAGILLRHFWDGHIEGRVMSKHWPSDFGTSGLPLRTRPNRGFAYKERTPYGPLCYMTVAGFYTLHGDEKATCGVEPSTRSRDRRKDPTLRFRVQAVRQSFCPYEILHIDNMAGLDPDILSAAACQKYQVELNAEKAQRDQRPRRGGFVNYDNQLVSVVKKRKSMGTKLILVSQSRASLRNGEHPERAIANDLAAAAAATAATAAATAATAPQASLSDVGVISTRPDLRAPQTVRNTRNHRTRVLSPRRNHVSSVDQVQEIPPSTAQRPLQIRDTSPLAEQRRTIARTPEPPNSLDSGIDMKETPELEILHVQKIPKTPLQRSKDILEEISHLTKRERKRFAKAAWLLTRVQDENEQDADSAFDSDLNEERELSKKRGQANPKKRRRSDTVFDSESEREITKPSKNRGRSISRKTRRDDICANVESESERGTTKSSKKRRRSVSRKRRADNTRTNAESESEFERDTAKSSRKRGRSISRKSRSDDTCTNAQSESDESKRVSKKRARSKKSGSRSNSQRAEEKPKSSRATMRSKSRKRRRRDSVSSSSNSS